MVFEAPGGGCGRRVGRSAWGLSVIGAVLVVGALLVAGCGTPRTSSTASSATAPAMPGSTSVSTAGTAVTLPSTPAGTQAQWLVDATAHLPIPEADIRAHFDATFLSQAGPAAVNQALLGASDVTVVSIKVDQPRALVLIVRIGPQPGTQIQVSLAVDADGLISGLFFSEALSAEPAAPTSWDGVDAAVRSAAPEVHLLVAKITGDSFESLHSIDPDTPAPLGSAFKLYVLDALGEAVAAGKVTLDQMVTITSQLKSLPSGELQNQPDGTRISVEDTAAKMISISDNTAADVLIDLVGRPSVEAALSDAGMADPSRDRPFLTTREMFALKLDSWPALAQQYVAADEAGRRKLLAGTVDGAALPTLSDAADWSAPRDIDSIEWFASAADLCRAYVHLSMLVAQPGLAQIGEILSINDGGVRLDSTRWKTTWFKGGSEQGVLTLSYLATTQSGESYMVAVLAEDPEKAIDETTAIPVLLSAVKGAFALAVAQ